MANGFQQCQLTKLLDNIKQHDVLLEDSNPMTNNIIHGLNINSVCSEGKTLLMRAVEMDDVHTVTSLLDSKADTDLHDLHGDTALMYAVKGQRLATLQALLQYGCDVNAVNNKRQSALDTACMLNLPEHVVKTLLQAGGRFIPGREVSDSFSHCLKYLRHHGMVNVKDGRGRVALSYAAEYGLFDEFQKLIHSAGLGQATGVERFLPSNHIKSITRDNVDTWEDNVDTWKDNVKTWEDNVKTWEENIERCEENVERWEENVERCEENVDTWEENVERCEENVDDSDTIWLHMCSHFTPNCRACLNLQDLRHDFKGHVTISKHQEINSAHLNRGLDVDCPDNEGKTVLMHALSGSNPSKFAHTLLQLGADIHATDTQGRNVLTYAVLSRVSDAFCAKLVANGADVNSRDVAGLSPLMHAIGCQRSKQFLLMAFYHSQPQFKSEFGSRARFGELIDGLVQNICNYFEHHDCKLKVQQNWRKSVLEFCVATDVNVRREESYRRSHFTWERVGQMELSSSNVLGLFELLRELRIVYTLVEPDSPLDLTRNVLNNGINSQVSDRAWHDLTNYFMKFRGDLIRTLVLDKLLLRFLVCNGIVCFLGNRRTSMSHFLEAGGEGIFRYFMANCCLSVADLAWMRDQDPEEKTKRKLSAPVKDHIKSALSNPWPLVKLSLIAVSTGIGYGLDRKQKIERSELPATVKDSLMFKGPFANIHEDKWADIPLTFDPLKYETLDSPRPLLDCWPVGNYLV